MKQPRTPHIQLVTNKSGDYGYIRFISKGEFKGLFELNLKSEESLHYDEAFAPLMLKFKLERFDPETFEETKRFRLLMPLNTRILYTKTRF